LVAYRIEQAPRTHPKGIRISDREMKAFEARHLIRHDFHGNWN
jgi:hypothetical protein